MRQPLRQKGAKHQQVSSVQSLPSPVGGWNDRDSLAAMKPTDAVALENWFPKTSYCEGRGGYSSHATGATGTPKTLAIYNGVTGSSKMIAFTSSGTYDVTSPGAVGASALARTNGKHEYVNFGDGTTNWLIAVNGVDKPAYYSGAAWTAVDGVSVPALTGALATTSISNVAVHKGRLWFVEKQSLSAWYLAAGAAGGALTEFSLEGVASRGGYLVTIATWTRDGGNGLDDLWVAVTSKGQVIIYQGTNPSSGTTWALVGVFNVGEPLGKRCVCQYGGDLIILTVNGAYPLSQALASAEIDYRFALTNKIENSFNAAARTYGSVFGWEAVVYPTQSALVLNIPQVEDGAHEQYVMNTITKAWCKFTNWNFETFAVLNNQLYACSGTTVWKVWSGVSDAGADIVMYGKQAFSYFGSVGVLKHFKMFRPVLAVNGNLSFLTDMDVDFRDTPITGSATYTVSQGAIWDTSLWDTGEWAFGMEVVREWTSPDEYQGYCASGKVKITTSTYTVQWMSSDYIFERGGIR